MDLVSYPARVEGFVNMDNVHFQAWEKYEIYNSYSYGLNSTCIK